LQRALEISPQSFGRDLVPRLKGRDAEAVDIDSGATDTRYQQLDWVRASPLQNSDRMFKVFPSHYGRFEPLLPFRLSAKIR
jgi:hypothetical protein